MVPVNNEIPADRLPYQLDGGKVGCLVLHGFMGSPKSSRPMAEFLNQHGITVHCPLLPGHGHLPARLYKVSYQQWLNTAERALLDLRKVCDEVFIIGHSMGAILGAHLTTQFSDVRAFVMLAPLYKAPRKSVYAMSVLRIFVPYLYPIKLKLIKQEIVEERLHDIDPTLDFSLPEVQEWMDEGAKLPTSAVDEMRKMASKGRRLWPRVNLPVLIFQGGRDRAVDPACVEKVVSAVAHPDKTVYRYPDASHELMRTFDAVHGEVWQHILDFFSERSDLLVLEGKQG